MPVMTPRTALGDSDKELPTRSENLVIQGAKKRKALRKKLEQEAIGANTDNKGNGHGHDGHDSQDDRESDGSLSSPGSQGNEEFGTKDPSATLSDLVKDSPKEKTVDAVISQGQREKGENAIAAERVSEEKPPISSPEHLTHNTRKVASQETSGILDTSPAINSVKPVLSVSNVVISDKNNQVKSSTGSNSTTQNSDEYEEKPRLKEAMDGNIIKLSGSVSETSREIKSGRVSEVSKCCGEKSLLPSGPPIVRTSWLSCCGLFDVMSVSER